ncbi:hypothetical protein [Nocardia noduli]|uniref:hypothetical protein n=1 Tax=Nocardia noduli TaxID=2815722 RepID=UPI001C22D9C5|nr:hypothetical protein [Nocardia noduli]
MAAEAFAIFADDHDFQALTGVRMQRRVGTELTDPRSTTSWFREVHLEKVPDQTACDLFDVASPVSGVSDRPPATAPPPRNRTGVRIVAYNRAAG